MLFFHVFSIRTAQHLYPLSLKFIDFSVRGRKTGNIIVQKDNINTILLSDQLEIQYKTDENNEKDTDDTEKDPLLIHPVG
jgi:hypothetical protein